MANDFKSSMLKERLSRKIEKLNQLKSFEPSSTSPSREITIIQETRFPIATRVPFSTPANQGSSSCCDLQHEYMKITRPDSVFWRNKDTGELMYEDPDVLSNKKLYYIHPDPVNESNFYRDRIANLRNRNSQAWKREKRESRIIEDDKSSVTDSNPMYADGGKTVPSIDLNSVTDSPKSDDQSRSDTPLSEELLEPSPRINNLTTNSRLSGSFSWLNLSKQKADSVSAYALYDETYKQKVAEVAAMKQTQEQESMDAKALWKLRDKSAQERKLKEQNSPKGSVTKRRPSITDAIKYMGRMLSPRSIVDGMPDTARTSPPPEEEKDSSSMEIATESFSS